MVWTTSYINDLPDSSFLYIEPGGKKDGDGKTIPRSKRHFPYKDENGKVDLPHLRNAIARIPQSNAPGLNKASLQSRAQRMLGSSNAGKDSDKKSMYEKKAAGPGDIQAHPRRVLSTSGGQATVTSVPKKKRSGEGTWARRKRHARQAAAIAAAKVITQRKVNKQKPRPTVPKRPGHTGNPKPKGATTSKSSESSLMVFKQANGKLRWVLFSSNPYLDRDKEFVTQKAHEEDIKRLDAYGDYGPLRWWHMGDPFFHDPNDWTTVEAGSGVDIGTCDFAAMHGRIRVESGTFKSEKVGLAVAGHAADLEGSLAFSHPRTEPDSGGGFLNIKSFERSLTPRDQATNIFTSLLVTAKGKNMDGAKLKALEALGVDIDDVLTGAEQIQKKADRTAPYRMKSRRTEALDDLVDEHESEEDDDLAGKLDALTAQIKAMEAAMKDEPAYEPEEKLEDLMVSELTVGELQDIVSQAISTKSAEPVGIALKAMFEELEEIKSILTSKSVQSVVDEVARMKAKLERQGARLKATASRVRELDEGQPTMLRGRGVRPSQSDDTLLDFEDDGDLSQKASSGNPFSWIDDFIQKQG